MRKNEIRYKNRKFATIPYFLLAAVLAVMVVIAINV
jgi:predicted nucleic acid-binding Zn ribbon protein